MANLAQEAYQDVSGDGHGPLYVDAGLASTAGTIYEGAMVALNSGGFAVKAGTAGAGPAIGVATATYVAGASNGAVSGRFRCGQFWIQNSTAADAITTADRFKRCYVVFDNQVAKLPGTGRALGGIVIDVDDELGVKVLIAPEVSGPAVAAPSIQVVTGALVAGVLTVATGITVGSTSEVVGITRTALGGTFSGGGYEALAADKVVGGPGTGTVVIRALASAGTANTADTSALSFMIVG